MARSKISSPSKDLIRDNGSVLISIVDGEQIHIELSLGWIVNLSSYEVFAKVVEGLNDGNGTKATDMRPNGAVINLAILDEVPIDNKFKIVIPQTLTDTWLVKPAPNKPVYGFIDLEVSDNGTGNTEQVWKPFRGLVEILWSPTEEV